jgi:hypothetical protein
MRRKSDDATKAVWRQWSDVWPRYWWMMSFLYICLLSICLIFEDSIKFDGSSGGPLAPREPPMAAHIL